MVCRLTVVTVGGLEDRTLPPDRRPTTTKTPSTTATAMARASVLLEGRILVPFREEHSGSFPQLAWCREEAARKAVELGWQDADRNADRQVGECCLAASEARRAYRTGYDGFQQFIQGRYEDGYGKYV
jgi:hypothetical protein